LAYRSEQRARTVRQAAEDHARTVRQAAEDHARAVRQAMDRWDGLLTACNNQPNLLRHEYHQRNAADKLSYEAFNYRAWSLVDYIASNDLFPQAQFRSMVYWVITHNRAWLDKNPFMFASPHFWKVLSGVSNEPLTLFRSEALPLIADEVQSRPDRYSENIDWTLVANNYDEYVITPLAESMVQPDPSHNNKVRNHLVTYFRDTYNKQMLSQMKVADYGCGPGNLLKHVADRLREITGVDLSQSALDIAAQRATQLEVKLNPVHSDISEYTPESSFDLIFSVNAILPATRIEVASMLDSIRRGLHPSGRLLAILPSFDTTETLMGYWNDHYAALLNDQSYIEHCMKAIKEIKKFDPQTKSFADDNIHSQCFHTPETIHQEFRAAGLRVTVGPQKIQYPWEIARRFDYGYFPGKEEIWDWFVVAEPVSTSLH
jgi:2-polyprenyl-3-methyl-5-hydroxy-6-metoxy-1,4-benzoquinol methylase